jgi:hypothetical protein
MNKIACVFRKYTNGEGVRTADEAAAPFLISNVVSFRAAGEESLAIAIASPLSSSARDVAPLDSFGYVESTLASGVDRTSSHVYDLTLLLTKVTSLNRDVLQAIANEIEMGDEDWVEASDLIVNLSERNEDLTFPRSKVAAAARLIGTFDESHRMPAFSRAGFFNRLNITALSSTLLTLSDPKLGVAEAMVAHRYTGFEPDARANFTRRRSDLASFVLAILDVRQEPYDEDDLYAELQKILDIPRREYLPRIAESGLFASEEAFPKLDLVYSALLSLTQSQLDAIGEQLPIAFEAFVFGREAAPNTERGLLRFIYDQVNVNGQHFSTAQNSRRFGLDVIDYILFFLGGTHTLDDLLPRDNLYVSHNRDGLPLPFVTRIALRAIKSGTREQCESALRMCKRYTSHASLASVAEFDQVGDETPYRADISEVDKEVVRGGVQIFASRILHVNFSVDRSAFHRRVYNTLAVLSEIYDTPPPEIFPVHATMPAE